MSITLKLIIWLCLFIHGCSKPIPDDKYTPAYKTVEWDDTTNIENNLPMREDPVTSEYKRNNIFCEKCAEPDCRNDSNDDCDECDGSNDCCEEVSDKTPSSRSSEMSKTDNCQGKPCNISNGGHTSSQKSDNTPGCENTNDCNDTPDNIDDSNDTLNQADDCEDNMNDCEDSPDNDNDCEDSQNSFLEDNSPCGENAVCNPPIDANTICNPPCDVSGGANCFDVHEHHHYHHHQPCCISIHHKHCHFHHHHHQHCHCHRQGCSCCYNNYKSTKLCSCCKHNNDNNINNNVATALQRDNTNNHTRETNNDTMFSNNSTIEKGNSNENIQTLEGNNSRIGTIKRGSLTVVLQ